MACGGEGRFERVDVLAKVGVDVYRTDMVGRSALLRTNEDATAFIMQLAHRNMIPSISC